MGIRSTVSRFIHELKRRLKARRARRRPTHRAPRYGAMCSVAYPGFIRLKKSQARGEVGINGITTSANPSRMVELPTKFMMAREFGSVRAAVKYCQRMTVPGVRYLRAVRLS
jgi:hypothetical protein